MKYTNFDQSYGYVIDVYENCLFISRALSTVRRTRGCVK